MQLMWKASERSASYIIIRDILNIVGPIDRFEQLEQILHFARIAYPNI